MLDISPLHLFNAGSLQVSELSRHWQVLNGAVAAIIAQRLNYICLHKPFQHGNQIHSAGLLSALWLVSRGSSLQRSCTKLKYPLYGKMTPMHTKWLIAENQAIGCEETWGLCWQNNCTFTDWIICHLSHDSFHTQGSTIPLFGIKSILIIKSPSWRMTE